MEQLHKRKFGRLTVESYDKETKICQCKCECGNRKEVHRTNLVSGKTKSCGCLRIEFCNSSKQKEILKKAVESQIYKGTRVSVIGGTNPYRNNQLNQRCITKVGDKYRVRLVFQGKCYSYGYHETLDEALKAREMACEELYMPIIEEYKKLKNA